MADTIDIGKLAKGFGPGLKIAVGTVQDIATAGSFKIMLNAPSGSQIMRDIVAVIVTPIPSATGGSVTTAAKGSSNGYVVVHHMVTSMGEFMPTQGTIDTIDIQYMAFARGGSL